MARTVRTYDGAAAVEQQVRDIIMGRHKPEVVHGPLQEGLSERESALVREQAVGVHCRLRGRAEHGKLAPGDVGDQTYPR